MATTPKNRRSPSSGWATRSCISRRYRGSKICSGSTTPGNRGVPSGNSGISSPIPQRTGRCGSGSGPAGRRAAGYAWTARRPPPRRHPVLARIDLRGSALPGTRELAGLLPRAATDIDSVHGHRPPAVRGRPHPRRPGGPGDHRAPRRRGHRGLRRAAGGARPGARRVRPDAAGRARGGDRPGPEGARRPAAHRRHHPGRARRHGDRALGAGPPGRPLRARRAGAAARPAWS